jgi:hypothetical protein
MRRGGRGARPGCSERHGAADDAAVHDAAVARHLEIGGGAVQQAAVVPHHQFAEPPAMSIDKARLRRVRQEFGEQRGAVRFGQPDDVRRMVADIERLAPGIRVRAHQRMHGAR